MSMVICRSANYCHLSFNCGYLIKGEEMFAANAARIASKIQPALTQSSRNMSVISGPPQVRISPAEKAVHGLVIAVGLLGIPAWVLVNMKNYRSHN